MSRLTATKKPQPKTSSSRRKSLQKLYRQWTRYFYWRFIHRRGTPPYLARGLAVGVFAGCFPFFGLQTLFGIALAILFRGHKILSVAGTWVSNPITSIPIYFFNFKIGQWLLGNHEFAFEKESLLTLSGILDLGSEFVITLLLGSLVVGIISAIVAYFSTLQFIDRWQQRQLKRRLKIQQSLNFSRTPKP